MAEAVSSPARVVQSGRRLYWRLLGYGRGMLWLGFAAIIGYIIQAAATAGLAEVLNHIINAIQQVQPQTRWHLAAVIVGAVLLRGLGATIGDLALARVSYGIVHKLRCALFERLLQLPSAFFDRSAQGHLVSRITFNVAQIRDTATDASKTLLEEGAMVIGLTGYLLFKNWKLTLVFLVIAPGIVWVMGFAGRRFRRISRRIQNSMGDVTQVATEAVSGHRVVRTFGGEQYERDRFHAISQYNLHQNMKMIITKAGASQVVQAFTALAVALLVVLVFEPSIMNGMDAGAVIAYITAAGVMLKPTRKLAEVNPMLQRGLAAAADIFSQLDADIEQDIGHLQIDRALGRVEFRAVSFGYERGTTNSVSDVSFVVEPGSTVALVGRSGSGKTTLASLIARFYSPSGGSILLDGQPLECYRLRSLRRQLALVSQHVTLFNDSISRNIAYGELAEATPVAIRDAARRAHALEFIDALPQGFDTPIGDDGVLLSGGQRQRLAIARAILKDAPILILDEATSALDSESERVIQAALDEVMRGRTTFVIAHRLTTIERADRIFVLDGGRIVEQGTHAELLAAGAAYTQLYASQFGGGALAGQAGAGQAGVDQAGADQVVADPAARGHNNTGVDETRGVDVAISIDGTDGFDVEVNQAWLHNESATGAVVSQVQQPWYGALVERWYETDREQNWLAPVGRLYEWASRRRRERYLSGKRGVWSAAVPVIVVGNITVGGSGKTPCVIWLALHLRGRGYRPGIVSRGYGGNAARYPLDVTPDTSWRESGDEAPMIAARSRCPVVVAPDRAAAVRRLLEWHDCDVVISDDGLQHYALGRAAEIAVIDGERGLGNGQCMPAGPLREPVTRLLSVDLVVCTGKQAGARVDELVMALEPSRLMHVYHRDTEATLAMLHGRAVHAFAGIGNPARFFASLRALGANVVEHALADHQALCIEDLLLGENALIVMTEKDAVKCRGLRNEKLPKDIWYLEVGAFFDASAVARIDALVERITAIEAHA